MPPRATEMPQLLSRSQLTLQRSPHRPVHVEPAPHVNVQPVGPQTSGSSVHDESDGQLQVVPVQWRSVWLLQAIRHIPTTSHRIAR